MARTWVLSPLTPRTRTHTHAHTRARSQVEALGDALRTELDELVSRMRAVPDYDAEVGSVECVGGRAAAAALCPLP